MQMKASQRKTIHKGNSSKREKYPALLKTFSRTFPLSVGAKIMCYVENSSTAWKQSANKSRLLHAPGWNNQVRMLKLLYYPLRENLTNKYC